MDPVTLATITSAVTVLATECAKKAAAEAGKDLWAKIKSLLKWNDEPPIATVPERIARELQSDPSLGPKDAPVTIVEFSDFQCPYCSRAESTVKAVLEKYKGKVRFVYRDYPLTFHPFAAKASEAAQCANDQGKFWEFHDALYADQTKLAVADMQATAGRLGMDAEKFKTCVESGKYAAEVAKDIQDATKAGVSSTPSFFINGVSVVGAQAPDAFNSIIDQELAKGGK